LGAGGAPPGFMVVKFDVNAPFNFSSYEYLVVFNTTNNGLTPLTNPFQNNWAAFSDAIVVGGIGGGTFANAYQFIKNPTNPAIPPVWQNLHAGPVQIQYIPNSNGTGTEFSVLFQRAIFKNLATPTPGPGPTPKTTAPPYSQQWTFNAFVAQANPTGQLIFLDSMGPGGATDTTYSDSPPWARSVRVSIRCITNFKTSIHRPIRPPRSQASRSRTTARIYPARRSEFPRS